MSGFKVGDRVSLNREFTDKELALFAEISGDDNPIHLDSEYAADTIFGRRIVHGILVAGLFSALIGTRLPGKGAIYLGQSLNFRGPVFPGENVEASVEVIAIREEKGIMTLRTLCKKPDGTVAVEGEAVVKIG